MSDSNSKFKAELVKFLAEQVAKDKPKKCPIRRSAIMSLQMTPSHQATSDKPPAALVVGTQFTVWAEVDGVCAL